MNKNIAVDMSAFTQLAFSSMVEYKMDTVKTAICDNEINNTRMKSLTVSLLDASKPVIKENTGALLEIAKCIANWEENSELLRLRDSILYCYANKSDVCRLYLCKDNSVVSFVVVMDDSTSDTVFEYNELGFELAEKYKEIEDFMVIDEEEAEGCSGLLSNYNTIYIRG